MVRSLLSFAAVAAVLGQQAIGAPTEKRSSEWDGWCTPEVAKKNERVAFEAMPPAERKAYSDAINCIHSQPSNLDSSIYSAAVNKYQDYAVVHVNRTSQVHLDGYFLTWHRYFLQLFYDDMKSTCGYTGRFPYWDFTEAAAGSITADAIFDGSEYSLSGNGLPNGTAPIALGPTLVVPHGSGGGCITDGPFKDWVATIAFIDPLFLISGSPLPPTAFNYNASCLYRDLNQYVVSTYCNADEVLNTTLSPSAQALEYAYNGVIGGSSLGIHSGGHFSVGGFMDSIHVSVQDPVWWALHTQVDRVYVSWQEKNPELADQLYGTMTANNAPPSANVTLDSMEPDWGYFAPSRPVSDLISITGGPFCYSYDSLP